MIKNKGTLQKISSWGGKTIKANVFELENIDTEFDKEFIAYGNGKSYGDSALFNNVIQQKSLKSILHFDSEKGVIHCQAGILLSELLEIIVPKGWFLKVTPGTKYITLGGAVAADVHGKNHHKVGCFSETINFIKVQFPNGDIVSCSSSQNSELYKATCGGLGLTGIIIEVSLNLLKIKGTYINQQIVKTTSLKSVFNYLDKQINTTYSVAWLDFLNLRGKELSSVIFFGEHSNQTITEFTNSQKINIPFYFPSFLINRLSMRFYNWNYKRKLKNSTNTVSINQFFYPLDELNNWNRVYGKKGLVQYQFVVPLAVAFKAISAISQKIINSEHPCYLAVLKRMGSKNKNYLSFPIEGYTLALDFKMHKNLYLFLNELDKMVEMYGGKIYLVKDSCMSSEVFKKGYPKWKLIQKLRRDLELDKINSLQSKRLGF